MTLRQAPGIEACIEHWLAQSVDREPEGRGADPRVGGDAPRRVPGSGICAC
ncbi:MAG TPA: hypothetical protein VJP05_08040 [Acidimicrobiia bacterium]|nr:hypothetical protein [Acidimicrobiia bacterium]